MRVLVAPTYPETVAGERALVARLQAYAEAAGSLDAEVHVRHHAWTPESIRAAAGSLPSVGGDLYAVLDDDDAMVTDARSLAADALLLERRVVLDRTDAVAYEADRAVRHDETMLVLCLEGRTAAEALALAAAPTDDEATVARTTHAADRLAAIGAAPGRPTLEAIADLLG